MLALDVGKLSFWLLVSLLASLAALAVVLGLFAVTGKRASRRLTTRLAVGVGAAAIIVPVAVIVIYTQFSCNSDCSQCIQYIMTARILKLDT